MAALPPSAAGPVLGRLGFEYERVPPPVAGEVARLLAQPSLDAASAAHLVDALTARVEPWKRAYGYVTQDLVQLHPGTPQLDELLARFDKPHTHADDEVRYIVDGEGLFGFFVEGESEVVVKVGPGDFLRVPAGVEHRFTLTGTRRIKALRLFTDPAGWAAQYTGRAAGPLHE